MCNLSRLRQIIESEGPIKSVRVSSAQARGRAKGYAYWGAVRYQITICRGGWIAAIAEECASSDRRSWRLVKQDADDIAEAEDRILYQGIGRVSERDAGVILDTLGQANAA